MPEITDLLERTTPSDLPPLDLALLASRGHRRRLRRRALVSAPIVATLLAVGFVVLDRPDDKPTIMGAADLTEPVGTWKRAADPPLGARSDPYFEGTLSDGRVVIWGGISENGNRNDDVVNSHADGAVYDPEADRWEAIPAAPLPEIGTGGAWMTEAQLSQDRLAVVTGSLDDDSVSAAVYDFATGEWTAAPPQSVVRTLFDGIVWDGTNLAVVRVQRGLQMTDHPAAQIDAAVTLRWSLGGDAWTTGAAPPLQTRFGPGHAVDGGRLALWGGIGENRRGVFADGAIYDLASDTWAPIAESPLSGRVHPSLTWRGGRLLVGGGLDRLDDPGEYISDAAWYDPTTGTWTEEAPAPLGGVARQGDYIVAVSMGGHSGPQPIPFLGPEGWEAAPLRGMHTVDDLTVATSEPIGNPGDGRFEIKVRAGKDVWLQAPEAPFTNRMDATVVATGDKLVVVGGREGSGITPVTDAWVWDIDG